MLATEHDVGRHAAFQMTRQMAHQLERAASGHVVDDARGATRDEEDAQPADARIDTRRRCGGERRWRRRGRVRVSPSLLDPSVAQDELVIHEAAVEDVEPDRLAREQVYRRRIKVIVAHDHVHVARRDVRAGLLRWRGCRRWRTGQRRAEEHEAYRERGSDD